MTPKHAKVMRNKEIARRRANGELLKVLMADYGIGDKTVRKIVARWSRPEVVRQEFTPPEVNDHLAQLIRETRQEMEHADPDAVYNRINDQGDYVK